MTGGIANQVQDRIAQRFENRLVEQDRADLHLIADRLAEGLAQVTDGPAQGIGQHHQRQETRLLDVGFESFQQEFLAIAFLPQRIHDAGRLLATAIHVRPEIGERIP